MRDIVAGVLEAFQGLKWSRVLALSTRSLTYRKKPCDYANFDLR